MKAHFKTAYLQREIPLDISVAAAVEVGDVVTLTKVAYTDDNGQANEYYKVAKKASGAPAVGDYIVAQSDMTLKSGAVAYKSTDIYGYYYDKGVAAHAVTDPSSTGGALAASSLRPKRGAFYKVTNIDDVYYTAQ